MSTVQTVTNSVVVSHEPAQLGVEWIVHAADAHPGLAGWVQAFGSIAALAIAIALPTVQRALTRTAARKFLFLAAVDAANLIKSVFKSRLLGTTGDQWDTAIETTKSALESVDVYACGAERAQSAIIILVAHCENAKRVMHMEEDLPDTVVAMLDIYTQQIEILMDQLRGTLRRPKRELEWYDDPMPDLYKSFKEWQESHAATSRSPT